MCLLQPDSLTAVLFCANFIRVLVDRVIITLAYQIAQPGKCVAQAEKNNGEPVIRDPHIHR